LSSGATGAAGPKREADIKVAIDNSPWLVDASKLRPRPRAGQSVYAAIGDRTAAQSGSDYS
jgi:hypothetical protein